MVTRHPVEVVEQVEEDMDGEVVLMSGYIDASDPTAPVLAVDGTFGAADGSLEAGCDVLPVYKDLAQFPKGKSGHGAYAAALQQHRSERSSGT